MNTTRTDASAILHDASLSACEHFVCCDAAAGVPTRTHCGLPDVWTEEDGVRDHVDCVVCEELEHTGRCGIRVRCPWWTPEDES